MILSSIYALLTQSSKKYTIKLLTILLTIIRITDRNYKIFMVFGSYYLTTFGR
jgi:hypothetical protein